MDLSYVRNQLTIDTHRDVKTIDVVSKIQNMQTHDSKVEEFLVIYALSDCRFL